MKVCAGQHSQKKRKIMSLGLAFKMSSGRKKVMGSSSEEKQQKVLWGRCELVNRAGTGSWISGGMAGRQPVKPVLQVRNITCRE